MEHCVNIEEEAVKIPAEVVFNKADGSENVSHSSSASSEIVLQVPIQINKTVQCMNEEIHCLRPLLHEACIFKVHEGLRKGNEEAYTPKLVSIGPYHHRNPKLRAMEEHKLRYLHSLLQRLNNDNNDTMNTSVEPYLLFMDKRADKACGYYVDPIGLEGGEFVRMMLLDACFIIEFLRKCLFKELRDKDDPIFRSSWMEWQIYRDIILLENQLPFFLLSEFFDMTHIPSYEDKSLMDMAFLPFNHVLPNINLKNMPKLAMKKLAGESKHFLDLIHRFYLPSSGETSDSPDHPTFCCQTSSVTELQEAGISFKVDDSTNVSIFDISFEHGHLKIPKLRVGDDTETFLRNIIAYEQHSSSRSNPKYFTDYGWFLDLLINTEKDVNALRLHGIIEDLIGDDDEVARFVNKLGDNVRIGTPFYYAHVCQKVNEHYERPWNQAMAKLRRNYFNNPWASISTVAAVVLLLLTLIQTLAALNPRFA